MFLVCGPNLEAISIHAAPQMMGRISTTFLFASVGFGYWRFPIVDLRFGSCSLASVRAAVVHVRSQCRPTRHDVFETLVKTLLKSSNPEPG